MIAAKGIRKARDAAKTRIDKREPKHVSEKTQTRIKQAKMASGIAVKVTSAVVVGAMAACNELAGAMADTAKKTQYGQKFAENDNENVKAAKEVGKATITGVIVIIDELKNAAVTLVSEVADAGADVAGHTYGDEVGVAAKGVAEIVTDGAKK